MNNVTPSARSTLATSARPPALLLSTSSSANLSTHPGAGEAGRLLELRVHAIGDRYPATWASKVVVMREVQKSALGAPHKLSLNCHSVTQADGSPLTDAHIIHDQHRVPGWAEDYKALVLVSTVGIG